MFGNLSRIFCRMVNSLLINKEIAILKWLVVNEIYNRSFVVIQVRLRSFAGPTERTWALLKLFVSILQYFYPVSIVLRDFLPALEDNNLESLLPCPYLFDRKTPLYSRGLILT